METKIRVVIKKEKMVFSKYNKVNEVENLNNTNVIDTKNLKFSIDYIMGNIELIASFLNVIIIKNKVTTVVIKELEIANAIMLLIKRLPNITNIIFAEEKELDYNITTLLLQNKNLKKIECYTLPEVLFSEFPENTITTRCEILFSSNFMKANNIKTYSDLYNKEWITLNNYLTEQDINDIIYFLQNNHDFNKIYINGYDKKNLLFILNLLNKYKVEKVSILLSGDDVPKDLKMFKKLSKKYKIKINIKELQEKEDLKKIIFLIFIILIIVILLLILQK